MSYDPKAVANYFLDLADRDHRPLSPMKIQKLIYYANGWYLAIKGQPLIDEQVEAWTFGPVIPSLYREFRAFGNQPITERALDVRYEETADGSGSIPRSTTPSIDDDAAQADYVKPILDRIWEVYGGYSAIQLSNLTHAKGSPWDQVATRYGGSWPKGTDIPIETIRDYFANLYAGGNAKS